MISSATVTQIQQRVREVSGYEVDDLTVIDFVQDGGVPESVIGPDYDDALEAILLSVCDDLSVEVGA